MNKNIEQLLKNYFKNAQLEILDNGKPQFGNIKEYDAVTLDYIVEYIIKEPAMYDEIAKEVLKLVLEKEMGMTTCSYAQDIVFFSKEHHRIEQSHTFDREGNVKSKISYESYYYANSYPKSYNYLKSIYLSKLQS